MKKKLLGILIALGISIPAYASMAVAPTKVEIDANKIRNNYATTAIEIKGDKVITKTGEHPIYFWQEDKSVEEINNIFIENYNKAVNSYQDYIKQEDGE